MRRFLTWLLGWQWVHCNSQGGREVIRRVRYTSDGRPYAIWCGANFIWFDDPWWKVTPLHWRPEPERPTTRREAVRVPSIEVR